MAHIRSYGSVIPSQVRYPWRATVRTLAAFVVSALLAGTVALPIVADALGAYLPEQVIRAITVTAGVCAALTALTTRLMALPAVNRLLSQIGLGASK